MGRQATHGWCNSLLGALDRPEPPGAPWGGARAELGRCRGGAAEGALPRGRCQGGHSCQVVVVCGVAWGRRAGGGGGALLRMLQHALLAAVKALAVLGRPYSSISSRRSRATRHCGRCGGGRQQLAIPRCSLLAARCVQPAHCSLLTTCALPPTAYYLLRGTCCELTTSYYRLRTCAARAQAQSAARCVGAESESPCSSLSRSSDTASCQLSAAPASESSDGCGR